MSSSDIDRSCIKPKTTQSLGLDFTRESSNSMNMTEEARDRDLLNWGRETKNEKKHKFGKNPPKDYQILRTHFLTSLDKKGFFRGLVKESPEYKTKFERADQMFALRHGWRLRVGEMDDGGVGSSSSNSNSSSGRGRGSSSTSYKDDTAAARTERMYRSFNHNFKKSKAASPRAGSGNATRKRSMSMPLRPQRQKVFSMMLAQSQKLAKHGGENDNINEPVDDELLLPTLLARPDENKRRNPRNTMSVTLSDSATDTTVPHDSDNICASAASSSNDLANTTLEILNDVQTNKSELPQVLVEEDLQEHVVEFNNATDALNGLATTTTITAIDIDTDTDTDTQDVLVPKDSTVFVTVRSESAVQKSAGQKRGSPAPMDTLQDRGTVHKKTLRNITPLHSFADTSSSSDSDDDSNSDTGSDTDESATSSLDDRERKSMPGLHQVHPSTEKLHSVVSMEPPISKRESGLLRWHGNTAESRAAANFEDERTDIKEFLTGRKPGFEWRLGDQIGSGAHGVVYRGLNQQTGALIAVKQIPIDGVTEAQIAIVLQREVDILTDITHPNVVRYFGMEVRNNFLHLMTEYVSGGSIADQLQQFGPMNEGLTKRHTHQILVGLRFLHSHGVVHRDIKGQNVLVSQRGILKLADFGAAQTFDGIGSGQRHALCGTPAFVAPEIILEEGHDDRADIWSLGCTIVQMLTAETPWGPMKFGSLYELLHHVAYGSTFPPCAAPVTPTLRAFLNLCFERDKKLRPAAGELLQHVLLASFDTRPLTPPTSPSSSPVSSPHHTSKPSAVDFVKVSPSPSLEETPSSNDSISADHLRDEDLVGLNAKHFENNDEDFSEIEVNYGGCCSCYHRVPKRGAICDVSGIDVGNQDRKTGAMDDRELRLKYARGLKAQRQRGESTRGKKCQIQ